MKIIASTLFAFACILQFAKAGTIQSDCKKWNCQDGIGGSNSGANRTCAQVFDTAYGVEKCQPNGWLCNASKTLTQNITCKEYNVLPWKIDLPAGDSCTSDAECYTRKCNNTDNNTKTCSGKDLGASCKDDKECYPGLYCALNQTCSNVAKIDQPCSSNIRCEFGSSCANNTCHRYGTIKNGESYLAQDNVLFTDPKNYTNQLFWVCENFWAYDTGVKDQATGFNYFVCGYGPAKNFTSHKRKTGDDDTCKYTAMMPNGTNKEITFPATCGYNHDGYHYCPKRRDKDSYDTSNDIDRGLWKENNYTCHHRTKIQYCRQIEDNNAMNFMFRQFMIRSWETDGDNYPLIADLERCTSDVVVDAKNYQRMVDSATSTVLSYFAIVAGFIALVLFN